MLQSSLAEILGGGKYTDHLLGGGKYTDHAVHCTSPPPQGAQKEEFDRFYKGLPRNRSSAARGGTTCWLQRKSSPAGDIRGGELHWSLIRGGELQWGELETQPW